MISTANVSSEELGFARYVQDRSLGVYVHLPFCERVCPYCDFTVFAARPLSAELERRYIDGVLAELAQRRADFPLHKLESLYFGGGTPSLFSAHSIERVVMAVRDAFSSTEAIEITLEVNPSTVERERLPDFCAAGANRFSVGVQSFDDLVLRKLGRAHRRDECVATLRAVRTAGCENLSLDLIYGAPGQTLDRFARDLEQAIEFAPQHISAYLLSIEAETPFAKAVRRGQLALPDEEEVIAMMALLDAQLAAAGLRAYELSNYAAPGAESVHNRRYWHRRPVLGIGVGAWSTEVVSVAAPHGARRTNVGEVGAYLDRVFAGHSAMIDTLEVLAPATARGEAMFLALRTSDGLIAREFAREFGAPPRAFFAAAIDACCTMKLLEEDLQGNLVLSAKGRRLSNEVFAQFVEDSPSEHDGVQH